MNGKYASVNGNLVPKKEMTVPIDNIELFYGFGVYETVKIRNEKVFFAEDHASRLLNSAKQIDLEHNFTEKQIVSWITELIKKNKTKTANIKIILLGGKTKQEAKLYMFLTNPLFIEKKDYREGIKVISFEYERFAPQAKTLSMLGSYVAYKKAKQAKAYDAIFINKNGNITEGTRSNFFAIKNKTLFSPPKSEILDGITRKTVIECAKENNYEIIEQDIPLKDIFSFNGAFLTNTSGKIVPIKTIDNQSFDNISEELTTLRKLYNEYLSSL